MRGCVLWTFNPTAKNLGSKLRELLRIANVKDANDLGWRHGRTSLKCGVSDLLEDNWMYPIEPRGTGMLVLLLSFSRVMVLALNLLVLAEWP